MSANNASARHNSHHHHRNDTPSNPRSSQGQHSSDGSSQAPSSSLLSRIDFGGAKSARNSNTKPATSSATPSRHPATSHQSNTLAGASGRHQTTQVSTLPVEESRPGSQRQDQASASQQHQDKDSTRKRRSEGSGALSSTGNKRQKTTTPTASNAYSGPHQSTSATESTSNRPSSPPIDPSRLALIQSSSSNFSNMMRGGGSGGGGGGRGRGRGGRGGGARPSGGGNRSKAGPSSSSSSKTLAGPLHSKQQILQEFGRNGMNVLKPVWADNPKSPLSNWFKTGPGSAPRYEIERGSIDGRPCCRCSVVVHEERGIVGVGDDPDKGEAEKLAAFSALMQLQAAGLLSSSGTMPGGSGGGGGGAANGNSAGSGGGGGGGESVQLSDGSSINYEKARTFMDWYCNRFKLGKPDITYQMISAPNRGRRGPAAQGWEAVMTVGGRQIGIGSAASKKASQIHCYFDVTQYLEKCDPELWKSFQEETKGLNVGALGLAPHLQLSCSDLIVDEVRNLCSEVRKSELFRRAPAPIPPATVDAVNHHPYTPPNPAMLERKSRQLWDRLEEYRKDPKLAKMRKTRDELPIAAYKQKILQTIESKGVTVLTAATGSGKSTQTPQFVLDDAIERQDGSNCRILVTQPRRLAALALADRVADERGQRVGQEVGYQVRFDAKMPEDHGSICFMTVGILLKRLQSALRAEERMTWLDDISHIFVDETHERDCDTDLLLVVLKTILRQRTSPSAGRRRNMPKLILMSATINAELFQRYFEDIVPDVPLLEIPGRTFPVDRLYLDQILPAMQNARSREGWVYGDRDVITYLDSERNPQAAGREGKMPFPLIAHAISHICTRGGDGHILVFLPGLDEMKQVHKVLTNEGGRTPLTTDFTDSSRYTIHYLHSSTPIAEQRVVFQPAPDGLRRVILATNIAETSVTIPNTTVVVDTGRVKIKVYEPERHISGLVTAWSGRANLDQRAGRAGRDRAGTYYGLYSTARLATLQQHQSVEMVRLDLQEVIMHVKALDLGAVEEVLGATIEPPDPSRVHAALDRLRSLGAMDSKQNLMPLGRLLLELPCDANLGKMIVFGMLFKCLSSALTIAAILGARDPFMSPPALKTQADEIKASWAPPHYKSDTFAIEAVFNEWYERQLHGSYSRANDFLNDNFLNKSTMMDIMQTREQLLDSLASTGILHAQLPGWRRRPRGGFEVPPELDDNSKSFPLKAALVALAAAPNFAIRLNPALCRTATEKNCMIHPSSVNSKKAEKITGDEEVTIFRGEKKLYTFQEKTKMVGPGGSMSNSGQTSLRNVTRIDPLTFLIFGSDSLRVTESGLIANDWLPIAGDLDALDDVQRLKTVLEACFLRMYEGLEHAKRIYAASHTRGGGRGGGGAFPNSAIGGKLKGVGPSSGSGTRTPQTHQSSRAASPDPREWEEYGPEDEELEQLGRGAARRADGTDFDPRLSDMELTELHYLAGDLVKILDDFDNERREAANRYRGGGPGGGYYGSAGSTRPTTPW